MERRLMLDSVRSVTARSGSGKTRPAAARILSGRPSGRELFYDVGRR